MERTTISTPNAPKAIGPYSQAVDMGNLVFLSGQVPLDPSTGKLVDGDISVQTEMVMKNLKSVLEAAGLSFTDVVKTTIYLADLKDFNEVNIIYGKYFTANPPARATIQVAGLPLGAKVEIEMIAAK